MTFVVDALSDCRKELSAGLINATLPICAQFQFPEAIPDLRRDFLDPHAVLHHQLAGNRGSRLRPVA